MRVLVTGAAGFVGSSVIPCLLSHGHEVIAVDRAPDALRRLAAANVGVATAAVDLGDADRVGAFLESARPEGLIHLAWYANPVDYLTSHDNLVSLTMTAKLIEKCLATECRKIVVGGSCTEYGLSNRLLVETDPADPRSLYAACKHAGWQVARAMAVEAGASLAWARIFHIHGPSEDPRRLIPWVASQLRAGEDVELTDGLQIRDHLHVTDVAAGLVTLLTSAASGIYNLCSGEPVPLRRVLETVAEIVGGKGHLKFGARPHRSNETMFLAGDSSRLRSLGWTPSFGLRDGLEDALRGAF